MKSLNVMVVMREIELVELTSPSVLFTALNWDLVDRKALRLATISNISFKIAPSAATSDELLSNSEISN